MKKFMKTCCIAFILLGAVGMVAGCNNGYKTYSEAYQAESGNGNSGGSSSGGGNLPASVMIPLYCRVSDIKVVKSGNYSVCTGRVTNHNTEYSFRFVKVKGVFKNLSGEIVDTDWTYAVGTEWLEPRESKTFRLSVPYHYSISTCSVTVFAD